MKHIAATLLFCLAIVQQASATNLRGRVKHNGESMQNIRVDLILWNGTQWVDMASALTDKDGYYYFLNYDSGKQFFISVSGQYYPKQPLSILNIQPPLYQDIPTITN